ncbi:hypothetical protein ACFPT7_19765 [Acidicapsa dinghuensis]|uniref:DUF2066 domain-containing protein n=1 Tax=Acidicapsa dinghuensis TaxID=2218256 RepID=A0ABW1EKM4_9BACT|nr:hypothetical protein [Acidicapsa dinghuensis]
MKAGKTLLFKVAPVALIAASMPGFAAQLSSDARTAIPHDVQQMVVIDYRIMQNSPTAMQLRGQVMPPELKQLEDALRKFGLDENADVEQLAFVLYRTGKSSDNLETVGIAQGQFPVDDVLANLKKQRIKPTLWRTNKIYPMGKTGMSVVFVDESTLVFGSSGSVKTAMDVRDGLAPGLLSNGQVMDSMRSVDNEPLWSVLDEKGTQTMMKQVLGEAGSVADFDTVKKRMVASYYTMDFQHGVKFDMSVVTGDNFAAATVSSLLNAAILYKKMSGTDIEKQALADTSISSDAGRLDVHFASSDDQFNTILKSPMFQSMVR